MSTTFQAIPRSNYQPIPEPESTPMSFRQYQEMEIDNAIEMMRDLTDLDDEEIYDEILNATSMTEFERNLLAERLGIS